MTIISLGKSHLKKWTLHTNNGHLTRRYSSSCLRPSFRSPRFLLENDQRSILAFGSETHDILPDFHIDRCEVREGGHFPNTTRLQHRCLRLHRRRCYSVDFDIGHAQETIIRLHVSDCGNRHQLSQPCAIVQDTTSKTHDLLT